MTPSAKVRSESPVGGSMPGINPKKFANRMNMKIQPKNGTIARDPCISVTSLTKPSSHSTIISEIERMLSPSSGTTGSAAPAIEARATNPKTMSMPITIQVPIRTSGIFPPPSISRKFTDFCKLNFSAAAILNFSMRAAQRSTPGFNNNSGHLSQDTDAEAHSVDARAGENQIDEANNYEQLQRNRQRTHFGGRTGDAGA